MFMHMFGPMKYVHMRRSGLIAFGGGDSGPSASEITSSVMASASPRFNTLDSGQANIRSDISGVAGQVTGLGSNLENARGDITNSFTNLNSYLADQFKQAGDQRVQSFSALGNGLVDLNNRNDTRANNLQSRIDTVGSDVLSGFNTTQDTMNQGFADATQRFNNLDTSVGDVQNSVDTGFNSAQTQLTDFRGDVTDRFDTAGEALSQGFATTRGGIENLQTETLGGQNNILSDLATAKAERDAYQTVNSETMADMQSAQDTFKSDFDKYVQDYGTTSTIQNETLGNINLGLTNFADDVSNRLNAVNQNVLDTSAIDTLAAQMGVSSESLANQLGISMNDLGGAIDAQGNSINEVLTGGFQDVNANVSGGFDQMGNTLSGGFSDIGNQVSGGFSDMGGTLSSGLNDANSGFVNGLSEIKSDISGLGNSMSQGFGSSENLLGALSNSLTSGFGGLKSEFNGMSAGQQEIASQLPGMMKTLSQVSGLPMEMRQQFNQVSNAFDQQGNLVKNSIDAQGNTITRALDNQGNLILSRFDATGSSLGRMTVNMKDMIAQIQNLGSIPGASANMGRLSAPLQDLGTGQGGFMSPYGMTQ